MPAAIVLLKTTLVLNVLSEHHQRAASKTTSSHDAIKSTVIEIGFVGCIANGKARAATVMGQKNWNGDDKFGENEATVSS